MDAVYAERGARILPPSLQVGWNLVLLVAEAAVFLGGFDAVMM